MAWTEKQKKAHSKRMKAMWEAKRDKAWSDERAALTREACGLGTISIPLFEGYAVPGYESLDYVLRQAYQQAAGGKGKERHATDLPFTEQPMQSISALLGSHNGLLYQAMKKIQESNRLPHDRAIAELLGAINYVAGAVIYLETKHANASA